MFVEAERRRLALDALIHDDDEIAIASATGAELLAGVRLATAGRRDVRLSSSGTGSVEEYTLAVVRYHAALRAHTRRIGRPRKT
ncbi:hypothetical protein FHR81_000906 [Actinoalloteichus hoggarensis]|uniref:Uncharacterized protein n=1 Tax=Actinoalloteichus hoggarensis TaxID=1470176 RepID=A0A221W116_9PSEU|nr:hypothetical protein [Actinoalloteichus hoggarensis]ASO19420.1 hypothetical protein AHOG_08880 [Actinoalloteichus hoggarensis]MBB5919877.1 hypothetical protein [Actinoalloteichus hoggarensis]